MRIEGISYLLQRNGYQIINSNVPFIKFYVKKYEHESDYNAMEIIGFVDNSSKSSSFSVEQLDNIAFQIERKFLFSGIQKVNMLYFIYSDNVERDKIYCECQTKFWILDSLANQLIIFENQPEDFGELRNQIERVFFNTANENGITAGNGFGSRGLSDVRHNRIYRKIPIITFLLVMLNVGVFIVLEWIGSTNDVLFMLEHGANYYLNVFEKQEFYRLFTCTFMHFGFAHLFNNMLSLWLLGSETERFYGRVCFTIIYMFSGFMGSLVSCIYNYIINDNVVSAGASGAIYGLIGALVVKIVENRKRSKSSFGRIVIVLIILMMVGRTGENIDNIAHLGGFAAGMISGIVCYKIKLIEK